METVKPETILKEQATGEDVVQPFEFISSSSELINDAAIKQECVELLVDSSPTNVSTNLDGVDLCSEQKPHYKSTNISSVGCVLNDRADVMESINSLQGKCILNYQTKCENCGMHFEDLKEPCCQCSDVWQTSVDGNVTGEMPISMDPNNDYQLLVPLVVMETDKPETICKETANKDDSQSFDYKTSSNLLYKDVSIQNESAEPLVHFSPINVSTNVNELDLFDKQISTGLISMGHVLNGKVSVMESRNSLQEKCTFNYQTKCENCGMDYEDSKKTCDCSDKWQISMDGNISEASTRNSTDQDSSNTEEKSIISKIRTPNYCALTKHNKNDSDKRYTCNICDKSFAHSSTLRNHTKIHSGEKPFICTVCNKRFTRSCNLVVHKRIHTGETPYTCDICNKKFSHSSHLTSHRRTHTGETPFCCNICNKKFFSSSHLTDHNRIHTGETPFSCNICHKVFAQSSTLIYHKRIHSGERPFTCAICNKSFNRSYTLTKHMKIHTG